MATDDLNLDDLQLLVEELKARPGVKYASTDPEEIDTPGVWVRFDGAELQATLTNLRVKVTLHLVVAPANERARTNKALSDLFNTVKPVVEDHGGATGLIKPVGLQLPGAQSPQPCLQIPLDLLTSN